MRETELWQRLAEHLGEDYCRTWAEMTSISSLGNRTVIEALRDKVPAKTVWRAVWEFLELPATYR